MLDQIKTTSDDFSKFITIDMKNKLDPLNKSIDSMLARLEEFQTMVCFAKQERTNATDLLLAIQNSSQELTVLFERIDAVEKLVEHVKGNLNTLEVDIEKAEEELGCVDTASSKVANIFTPLFQKKSTEKKGSTDSLQLYKTSDYFTD